MGRLQSAALESAWRIRLSRFVPGQMTVAAFCAREGISPPSFYIWRKRLRMADGGSRRGPRTSRREPADTFLPITIKSSLATQVDLPNGIRIHVPHAETLCTVLRAASQSLREESSC